MDTFTDDSLHTTCSSVDLGTTLEESDVVASTIAKDSVTSSRESVRLPSPSQQTLDLARPSGATAQETNGSACAREQRLRNLSFRRQKLEIRLDNLNKRNASLSIRDERIKRRYAEMRLQRSKMTTMPSVERSNSIFDEGPGPIKSNELETRLSYMKRRSASLIIRDEATKRRYNELSRHYSKMSAPVDEDCQTDSDSDQDATVLKRVRFSLANTVCKCRSQQDLITFQNVSDSKERAMPETLPRFRTYGTTANCSVQTDMCDTEKKPVQKVRKTRSLRLKRFVQKRLGLLLSRS